MVNGIRIIFPCGLNKGLGSKFCVGSQVRNEMPEDGNDWLKGCECNNDKNPNTLINKKKY